MLRAEPDIRLAATRDSATRRVLSASERQQNAVLIVKRGDEYFWASREDRPLVHVLSGVFHLFIEPSGGGYVKVLD